MDKDARKTLVLLIRRLKGHVRRAEGDAKKDNLDAVQGALWDAQVTMDEAVELLHQEEMRVGAN